jgi:hypothetical protein
MCAAVSESYWTTSWPIEQSDKMGQPPPPRVPRIVLKARPTPAQIADRLRDPAPEGLEIYLDARDIAPDDFLPPLIDILDRPRPADFAFLVEGPVRSLDGAFFDLTIDSGANRTVVDRLARFGGSVGAIAACVHLIAPTDELTGVSPAQGLDLVDACLPLTRYYVARCLEAGLVPTVENVPPIAQMRESRVMTSTVGAPPEHLARLADRVDGLRFTIDTSHAQLFLNAASAHPSADDRIGRLVERMADASPARDFASFLAPVRGRIETAHVSDAEGIFGEGLPYGLGTMDLDGAVDLLLDEARSMVTETLEPDPDHSRHMRYAGRRIAARRAARLVRA